MLLVCLGGMEGHARSTVLIASPLIRRALNSSSRNQARHEIINGGGPGPLERDNAPEGVNTAVFNPARNEVSDE